MRTCVVLIALSCSSGLLAVERDVTAYGTPVAAVTVPLGGGNKDIEVIRDGVTPPVAVGINAGNSLQQYDTWDGGNFAAEDWFGYEFSAEMSFTRLVFQEGKHFGDGGFFDPPASLVVQVQDGDGLWSTADGSWDPPYTGMVTNGQVRCFETFTWILDPPAVGRGIRVWGEPGGTADFTSVAELRAFADLEGDLPQAAFTQTHAAGPRPLSVSFDASPSAGTGLAYAWDFGDGATATGVTASHVYDEVGAYDVTLVVSATLSGIFLESRARSRVLVGLRASEVGRTIALVTAPTGGGSRNIELIRDGVRPAITSGQNVGDSQLQYDTVDAQPFSAEDWIGYEWDCIFTITKVVFQEGKHFFDGGYFDPPSSLVVQVRDPDSGEWITTDGEWDPPYQGEFTDGQIVNFETFTWTMDDEVEADAVRIWGEPGGSADFISVAELEVYSDSPEILPVASFTATPTEGTAPLPVAFDASASLGTGLAYQWDFGDGQLGTGVTAAHTYSSAGTFTATLTVSTTLGGGCDVSDTAAVTIKTAFDLAPLGVIVARVPSPLGGGNLDPNVVRDGVRPAVTIGENVGDSQLQYDTYDGANFAEEDWIGYRFGCTYRFSQVVFQEGKHFFDGGYFSPPESLVVQVHDPATDAWNDVGGEWEPFYEGQYTDGEIRNFETFTWEIFPLVSGDGIRIHGTPGGAAAFISVAELEVYAEGVSGTAPEALAAADATRGVAPLTVTFDGSGSAAPAGSTYEWSFGDGETGTGQTATHTYAAAGSYTATLTVKAPGGLCASAAVVITVHPSEFSTAQGFVRRWLILGPYTQLGGPNPLPESMEADYLTDGADLYEVDILPEEGLEVPTDYGVAASTGLLATARADINPGGLPAWFVWEDGDDTINFEEVFQTVPIEGLMVYACVYATNEGVEPLVCDIGCASDDSIQVLLDDVSVHINSIERGYGAPEEIQDVVPGVTLPPGRKVRLLVKLFQGVGGVGFRLRFQDADGTPITEPAVTFSLEPGEGPREVFRRGDADAADGVVNITDAIFVLNYLFQGGAEPPCLDAADADNEFGINITDGIYILSYLFLGGLAPPAPGPDVCGPDPAADPPSEPVPPLDCKSYPPGC